MPKVSALTPQQKNPHRYNLFIDGEFYCGVDEDTIAQFKIKEGNEFSDAELEEIYSASEQAKLYQRALDFLAFRPRSIQETRKYLQEKIFKYKLSVVEEGEDAIQDLINSIVGRLEKFSYVNDQVFVRWWIEQRTSSKKPNGYLKIKSELVQKGVDQKLINQVWQELRIDEGLLAEQHFSTIKNKYDLSNFKDKQRLIMYFQRKGFRWGEIQSVLK